MHFDERRNLFRSKAGKLYAPGAFRPCEIRDQASAHRIQGEFGLSMCSEDSHGRVRQLKRYVSQQHEGRTIGLVQVVDHQKQGARGSRKANQAADGIEQEEAGWARVR